MESLGSPINAHPTSLGAVSVLTSAEPFDMVQRLEPIGLNYGAVHYCVAIDGTDTRV